LSVEFLELLEEPNGARGRVTGRNSEVRTFAVGFELLFLRIPGLKDQRGNLEKAAQRNFAESEF
jgi:hypothetical protein